MILAGDLGGTNTRIGLFDRASERPQTIEIIEVATNDYERFEDLLADVLEQFTQRGEIEAACFGVAGPVIDQVARLTNVAWRVDADEIDEYLGGVPVWLLNDLAAMAYSIPVLEADELAVLQEGQAVSTGNAALMAAGTGLGEALLHNIDGRFVPSPSEGGHGDLAARTPRELALLAELIRLYGRAEYEHVLSGPGIVNLFRFTHRDPCPVVPARTETSELPARISASALEQRCPACVEALDLFVGVFGAEAGNLALRGMATAGVYIGGGIAPRILPALESGIFLEAFRAKDPMTDLMASIPVSIILNTETGLLGAAVCANERLGN